MNKRTKVLCSLLLLSTSLFSYGQISEYSYKRELTGITDQWHRIILPKEVFGKTSQSLRDFRIYGVTKDKDTIEAPFLLRIDREQIRVKNVAFETLNTSQNKKGHYITFEVPNTESINQIDLEFKQENFDWQIQLEGSQEQREWFTIVDHYRILAIKNKDTDFQFTKLKFPSSKYRFYRIRIASQEKPELRNASTIQNEITKGAFRKYNIQKIKTKENKQTKQTEIYVKLELPVRISSLKIGISNTFDYYRPISIEYLKDSIKTDQGWKYDYRTLTSGSVNSIEENEFHFKSKTVQNLKIFIDNKDNPALAVDTIEVSGYKHELIGRFTEPATYYLTYGNSKATKANYDIQRFTKNIPETMTILNLGEEIAIEKKKTQIRTPIFEDSAWLWTIITTIILALGWFSLRMIRKK